MLPELAFATALTAATPEYEPHYELLGRLQHRPYQEALHRPLHGPHHEPHLPHADYHAFLTTNRGGGYLLSAAHTSILEVSAVSEFPGFVVVFQG